MNKLYNPNMNKRFKDKKISIANNRNDELTVEVLRSVLTQFTDNQNHHQKLFIQFFFRYYSCNCWLRYCYP